MWAKIWQMYEQTRAENPKDIGPRNENQMKGRFKRLNENANNWVDAYKAAYSRMKSGMIRSHPKSIEYHEWESRVVQYNQRTDRILEDVIINYPNLVIQDQTPRARRAYRDREREQGETRLMADYFVDNPTFDEVIFRRRFRMRKHLFIRIVDSVTANDRYFQQRRDATGRQSLNSFRREGWAGQYAGRSGKPTIILEAVASYDLWIWHAFFGTPGSCNDINVLHRSPVFNDVLEGRARM
ncbi:putative nuclease HARBI1 [Tanacetum coccineum]